MILTDDELNRIAKYIKDRYGVDLHSKRTLISGRLDNKLTNLGYSTYTEFMDKVMKDPSGDEATLLVNTLTTNHTFFLREALHFDFLRETALPEIKQKAAKTKDVRIWSAAASSGEEAYTIVMTIKDFFGLEADAWDTKVLATDVSTKVLEQAKQGIYRADQLDGLPDRWVRMHFKKISETEYQVKPETRSEVIFHTFNLMDDFPWKKRFNIIFLRNVMIYFDEPTKANLIRKMCQFLEPGGYLFIGTTETIEIEGTGLRHVRPSIYTRVV